MQKKRLPQLLLLLALLLPSLRPALAQQLRSYPEQHYGFRCASDSMQRLEWQRHPGEEQAYKAFLKQVANLPAAELARLQALPDVTIPVVVHIMHTGGANNITDAQVNDAIRILNEDYSKTNRDTTSVIAAFQSRYANIGFRFRLAKKDPDGNCTTGITRTYTPLTATAGNNVKDLVRWSPNNYLNIWVVDVIASGAGGYAYLPCPGTTIDGIVISNRQFGSIGRSYGTNFANRSLTHEVGHYFGLPHTWGNSNTPGSASNCGLDDGIADTPNTSGVPNQTCNLSYSPCTDASGTAILSNVQNYMDYSTCAAMFTTGQRAVMRASLLLGCRSSLVSAQNLLDTGTNDGYNAVPCAPVAAFEATTPSICTGGSVSFTDYSYNFTSGTATQYQWSFPGGTPATSTSRTPTVSYATGGAYDVTLIVSNATGSDTLTRTQLVQVQSATSGLQGPVFESFENASFPQNFANDPIRNWRITSSQPGEPPLSWQRISGTASNGSAYLIAPNNYLAAGAVSTLTSPNINLSGISSAPVLVFDRAYALRTASTNDVLRVLVSTNCGLTWSTVAYYSATALDTRNGALISGYIPTSAADWQPLTVSLAAYQGAARLLVRFESVSDGGNRICLDNLRILDPLGTQDAEMARLGIGVYPNPLTAETAVHFTLSAAQTAAVRLTDVLGREVMSTPAKTYGTGAQAIRLQGPNGAALPAGVYVVHLTLGTKTFNTKVVVQ